jgi:hypothetical protein
VPVIPAEPPAAITKLPKEDGPPALAVLPPPPTVIVAADWFVITELA